MNLRFFFLVCSFVKGFASESLSPINQPLQKHMFLDKTLSLTESLKDPVAFAEVFATADATTVKRVLLLMEELANASLASKQLLVFADVAAEKEMNNTNKNHEEAVEAEKTAKTLYDTAVTIKTQTATALTEQGPGLDSEHETITKVIELLESLVPNATEAPTEAATEEERRIIVSCPSGFTKKDSNEFSFCYKGGQTTFAGAKQDCENHDMRLVEITSEEKALAIDSFAAGNYIWIGLTCKSRVANCQTDFDLWYWQESQRKLTETEGWATRFVKDDNGNIYGGGPGEEYCAHWWYTDAAGSTFWAPHPCNSGFVTLCE